VVDPDQRAEQEKWRRKNAWYERRLVLEERFLREYPSDPAAPDILLEVATWNTRPPEVGLKILDTLGSTIPLDDYRRLSARAQLLAQTNRVADWVDTCRAMINAAPEEQKIFARVRLCEALIKDGKPAEARQILEDIVGRNGSVGYPQKNAADNARKLLSSLQS
jgi:predicted Zn-dependent protease